MSSFSWRSFLGIGNGGPFIPDTPGLAQYSSDSYDYGITDSDKVDTSDEGCFPKFFSCKRLWSSQSSGVSRDHRLERYMGPNFYIPSGIVASEVEVR